MGYNNDCSIVMAERIKTLREKRGLSHERLSKAIKEKYGIEISSDSLMNYEVSDENHTKFGKNRGMRVQYLCCLSDFYGVSSDYILGMSDIKTPDTNAQSAIEYTGLSEGNIKMLHYFKENARSSLVVERSEKYRGVDGCGPILDCFNDVFDALVNTRSTADRIAKYYIAIRQETGHLGENKGDFRYVSDGEILFSKLNNTEEKSNAIVEYLCMKIGREIEKKLKDKYVTHYLTSPEDE